MIPTGNLGNTPVPFKSGEVSILSVGKGDLKFTFDTDDPAELEKAEQIVGNMIDRGYVLMVRFKNGKTRRVKRFSKSKREYIVADLPKAMQGPIEKAKRSIGSVIGIKPKEASVPAKNVELTAIAPTAGG